MRIAVGFEGFSALFPRGFEKFYLGGGSIDVAPYQVDLDITVHFSPWALLSARGWVNYRWLDSFLDRMDAEFSFERFLAKVGWETALSTAIIRNNMAAASQPESAEAAGEARATPMAAREEGDGPKSPAGPVGQGPSN